MPNAASTLVRRAHHEFGDGFGHHGAPFAVVMTLRAKKVRCLTDVGARKFCPQIAARNVARLTSGYQPVEIVTAAVGPQQDRQ